MKKEIKSYGERLNDIFGDGSYWRHSSFRTILDPFSHEWSLTSLDEKIEILEKLVDSGENLRIIILLYKERFDREGRPDISSCVEDALARLLQHYLENK